MLFFDVFPTVLFEDAHLLAVNKPSGVPSHSLRKDLESGQDRTVEAQVLREHPGAHLLHRLDTGTSGVLLFAKNDSVFAEMREKFKLKDLKKFYIAWSDAEHALPHFPLKIEVPLGHHPKSAKRMVIADPAHRNSIRGKTFPALTHLFGARPVEREGLRLTEFDLQIITGVTHQIRVHLKHIGFPLLGDKIYNPRARDDHDHRLGLHARRVEFSLRGHRYEIEAPLPESLLLEK